MFSSFKQRWYAEGGYLQLQKTAWPLIMSTGSMSVLGFTDRAMLSNWSEKAVAAAMPAGLVHFTLICFFIGLTSYAGTLVSQYTGALRPEKTSSAIWQGIWLSIIGGAMVMATIPLAPWFFNSIGHPAEIVAMEIPYYIIMCLMSIPVLVGSTLSSFWSGRGLPWPVAWVHFLIMGLNIVLDYAFIFGAWGIPEMGIAGAAWASLIAQSIGTAVFIALFLSSKHDQVFQTRSGWRYDADMMKRLLKFGTPSGLQFFLDLVGFSVFMLMMGRLGEVALAASNITIQLELLVFLPLVGIGIAVSIFVGQYQGAGKPHLAEYATLSGLHLAALHSILVMILFLTSTEYVLMPFGLEKYSPTWNLANDLILYVVIYMNFNAVMIIFSSALKGAGDTAWLMKALGIMSFSILALPTFILIEYLDAEVYDLWTLITFYVFCLALAFYLRFRHGFWKGIQVID
jgi:MATE family multidrug resistance protein